MLWEQGPCHMNTWFQVLEHWLDRLCVRLRLCPWLVGQDMFTVPEALITLPCLSRLLHQGITPLRDLRIGSNHQDAIPHLGNCPPDLFGETLTLLCPTAVL